MPNIYLLVAALVAAIACSFFGYQAGESANEGKHAIADRAAQDKFDAALAAANLKLREEERLSIEQSNAHSSESQRLKKEANDANQKLAAAVRAGSQRVFVDSKCAATGSSAVSQAGTDSSRPSPAGATQLDSGIAEGLVAFGGKFDQLQLNYNRCYQALVDDRK